MPLLRRRRHAPPAAGPPVEAPTEAPDYRRMLKPAARETYTAAELWLLTNQCQMNVPGKTLLKVARACGWTTEQYAAVLASLSVKLSR